MSFGLAPLGGNSWVDYANRLQKQEVFISQPIQKSDCMHVACPSCNGTGVKKETGGACIHGISCPCKNCRIYA